MSEKLDALDALIEAVEAGRLSEVPFELSQMRRELWEPIVKANSGSLDAAKALHDALLPGWALERLNMWPGSNGTCLAALWGTHEVGGKRWHNFSDGRVEALADTPARAWLLAILRAYRSEVTK